VVVCTPEPDPSYCHTAAYTCGVAAVRALLGEDVSSLGDAVAARLAGARFPVSGHERFVVAGAGRDWPTAQEAVLKLREGVHVAAEAHRTEELLHGHLAALDASVRAFVLEGEGPAADRAAEATRALELVGCEVTLVPTSHPVVDIVPFQLLTVDLAADRGLDPDLIRWDEEPWNEARKSYK
jgi:glutamine---fructose-6-phosphate transaminase (isomerizing)